ncbi:MULTISPECIES: hypothetical protein [Mumia]|uniref:hypothetical protein n=1 Tax=Mumia TaxID=1546255 RepID=UPI00141FACEE|nr:hypothetical protein [Mumia sp. ZJ430]
MLVAVAVVPQTPLLVPEIAAGAAGELEPLRAAAIEAVREAAGVADRVMVVAPGPGEEAYDSVVADFSAFGYECLDTGASDVRPGSALPLGEWLLSAAGVTLPRTFRETTGTAIDLGGHVRTALLVLADGTAKREESAPGHVDVRSLAFDAVIGTALAGVDLDALASLDPALADALWASGAPAFRALAATVRADAAEGWAARLRYDGAPYGVAYWVAVWSRKDVWSRPA